MAQAKKPQVQIIILGDGAVGKTSIIKRYANAEFDEEHITTLGLDFVTRDFTPAQGSDVKVKIWDTAGQDRFKTLTYSFYKKADGIIIAFDVTDYKTFENITNWVESIDQHANGEVPRVMVGNKIDLDDRKVSADQANTMAAKHNMKYYDVSAKKDINI